MNWLTLTNAGLSANPLKVILGSLFLRLFSYLCSHNRKYNYKKVFLIQDLKYCKFVSTNMPCLESYPRFYRTFMKRKFDVWVICITFWLKLDFLICKPFRSMRRTHSHPTFCACKRKQKHTCTFFHFFFNFFLTA